MKAEILWLPLVSASLVCAGTRYPSSAALEAPPPLSVLDAGPSSASADAGTLTSEDAGTPLSFPDPDEMRPGDVTLDGAAFKALRVAVEDFKPRDRKSPPDTMQACFDDEATYQFQVQRRGDVFFIRVMTISERCDPVGVYVDGGVEYIIHVDGRILRKRYEGQR